MKRNRLNRKFFLAKAIFSRRSSSYVKNLKRLRLFDTLILTRTTLALFFQKTDFDVSKKLKQSYLLYLKYEEDEDVRAWGNKKKHFYGGNPNDPRNAMTEKDGIYLLIHYDFFFPITS